MIVYFWQSRTKNNMLIDLDYETQAVDLVYTVFSTIFKQQRRIRYNNISCRWKLFPLANCSLYWNAEQKRKREKVGWRLDKTTEKKHQAVQMFKTCIDKYAQTSKTTVSINHNSI